MIDGELRSGWPERGHAGVVVEEQGDILDVGVIVAVVCVTATRIEVPIIAPAGFRGLRRFLAEVVGVGDVVPWNAALAAHCDRFGAGGRVS